MDLIYTDSNGIDVGVLDSYALDLAYGEDENDFRLTVALRDHALSAGCCFYIENIEDGHCVGTEYGGIVDSITSDTGTKQIAYEGRTWHGVIENKVITPDAGADYYVVQGNANAVLAELIDRLALSDLFVASEEESDVVIAPYQFPRYAQAYTAICNMLHANGGKLKMTRVEQRVQLTAVQYCDYSNDEEWDSSQIAFSLKESHRPVNHLICLGQGNLRDRAVIHLFTDENGGIMPYAKTDLPLQDSDYILDTSQQKLFGVDEVAAAYDYSNAEIATNYVPLEAKPEPWDENTCGNYFVQGEDGDFDEVEVEMKDAHYALLKSKPAGWEDSYADYFIRIGTGESDKDFESVDAVEKAFLLTSQPSTWGSKYESYYTADGESVSGVETYSLTASKPSDWETNCDAYYTKSNDGTKDIYSGVDWETIYGYGIQVTRPTDWATNYGSYYTDAAGKNSVEAKEYTKYEKYKGTKQPADWKTNYAAYCYRTWDGAQYVYNEIGQATYNINKKQTAPPTDWVASWSWQKIVSTSKAKKNSQKKCKCQIKNSRYYVKNSKGKYVEATYTWTQSYADAHKSKLPSAAVLKKLWKKNKFYTRYQQSKVPSWSAYASKDIYKNNSYSGAPEWKANTYYTRYETGKKAPAWKSNTYWAITKTAPAWKADTYYMHEDVSPPWQSGKYYMLIDEEPDIPVFQAGQFYQAVKDRYADLVENALEKLSELREEDNIDIDLNEFGGDYDVGDVVGAVDNNTGMSVWQPVTKKILKIEDGTMSLSYEIGGNAT